MKECITVAEAAKELGLSKSRLEQFIGDGKLSVAAVVGNLRLVRRKDVAALKPFVRGKAGRPPNSATAPDPPPARPARKGRGKK